MTLAQAARYTGLSRWALARLVQGGTLRTDAEGNPLDEDIRTLFPQPLEEQEGDGGRAA